MKNYELLGYKSLKDLVFDYRYTAIEKQELLKLANTELNIVHNDNYICPDCRNWSNTKIVKCSKCGYTDLAANY